MAVEDWCKREEKLMSESIRQTQEGGQDTNEWQKCKEEKLRGMERERDAVRIEGLRSTSKIKGNIPTANLYQTQKTVTRC